MKKVFVLGSINLDYVISVDKMPQIGESRNGHNFIINQGGKGANQAIACKKLGCENVSLIASVGNDANGEYLINEIKKYGINTEKIIKKNEVNSGCCIITLDESVNDNTLIIDRGANDHISIDDFKDFLSKNAEEGDILISQLEVSLDAIYEGLKLAKELKMYTILNPAPFTQIKHDFLKYVDLIIPNETECYQFSKITVNDESDALRAYDWFHKLGVKEVVITLGSRGSYYISEKELKHFGVRKVKAVDTTGAGDTYIGALAYKKANGISIIDSMNYAALCSSITVSRMGAGKSIPTKEEVLELEKGLGF